MIKTGITLSTVNNELSEDFIGTFRALKDFGVEYVEILAGMEDEKGVINFIPIEDYKAALEETGIKVVSLSCHSMGDEDVVETAIYNTLALGAKELVLAENFTDGDVVHEIAEQANRFGKKCLDAGLTLSYHNAYDDMKRVGDESLLDIFLDETCPELVHLELNSFWSFCNGMTPLEYLKKYGARARLLHVTDLKAPINYELLSEPMTDDAFAPLVMHTRMTLANFTELGQGALEIRELAAEAVKLGIEAIIIEQYSTEISPLESSRISIANLNKAVAAL